MEELIPFHSGKGTYSSIAPYGFTAPLSNHLAKAGSSTAVKSLEYFFLLFKKVSVACVFIMKKVGSRKSELQVLF